MDASLTYSLTFEEYHSGARFARIRLTGKSAQPHHRALAKTFFVILGVALLLMLACQQLLGISFDRSQWILFAVTALLVGTFYSPFMERQWDRRIYKDSKFGESVEMKLLEDHLSVTLPDNTEIRLPWQHFSYIENEKFMILISPAKWIIMPKHLFAGDGLDQVRTTLPLGKGKS